LETISDCVGPIIFALKTGIHIYYDHCFIQSVRLNFIENDTYCLNTSALIDGTSFTPLTLLSQVTIMCLIPADSNVLGTGSSMLKISSTSADFPMQCYLYSSHAADGDVSNITNVSNVVEFRNETNINQQNGIIYCISFAILPIIFFLYCC